MDDTTQAMRGKVCVVTGATSGIGFETALGLASRGAEVIAVARNPRKAETAVKRVRRETGNELVSFALADLSSQEQVRSLAAELARLPRLDVLINNAGAVFMDRQESVDGIEMTFAVNYLAPFLLTNLLVPRLVESAPSRIINVSSAAHRMARPDFEGAADPKNYGGWRAYALSKLALVIFTYELARRLEGTGVTVNALHPGLVASNFARNNGWWVRIGWRIVSLFSISPRKGAETSIYLASSPDVQGVTGEYFDKKRPVRSSDASYDLDAARRLWEMSEELTGVQVPA